MNSGKPNIVFTIADDQRHDMIGAVGNAQVRTPNLDRLCNQGTALTHCNIMGSLAAAVCGPSRAMLHTGRSLFRLPREMLRHACSADPKLLVTPDVETPTLGRLLRDAGYHTYGVGKWHNGPRSFADSFDDGARLFFGGMIDHYSTPVHDFDPTGQYPNKKRYVTGQFSTDMFTDAAVNFLRSYDRSQPFFLYVAYTAPHDPRTPPPEYSAMYPPGQIKLPPNFMARHPFDNGEMDIRDEKLTPTPRTPEVVRQHLSDYYGMVSHMDAGIGRIHETLEAAGLSDNTIVIHAADHGLAVGQHGLMGKQNMYDHSVRVPLVMRGPGIARGCRSDALCYLTDLFPTLCEAAGASMPGECEGQSLWPVLGGQSSAHRRHLFAAYCAVQRMIRDRRHKLIEYSVAGGRRTQLFDLQSDPWEMTDLSGDAAHAATMAQLRQLLAAEQRRLSDPCTGLFS